MNRNSDEEPLYPQFEGMLADLDELRRLKTTVRAKDGVAAANGYSGLSTFVDAVLPRDPGAERRIARALRIDEETLRQFRHREVDPAELPPDSLATLGRCTALDWATFDKLIARDLTWFAEESPLAMLRDNTADPADVRRALRLAWERDTLDDPASLDDK